MSPGTFSMGGPYRSSPTRPPGPISRPRAASSPELPAEPRRVPCRSCTATPKPRLRHRCERCWLAARRRVTLRFDDHERNGMSDRLSERLGEGPVLCAEGYLFELERRGYLQAGAYVPEVVLEHPEMVAGLHREFVHAGSDVVEAFTYYAHREKLRLIGREGDLQPMNPQALRIAQEGGGEHDSLVAGNICNTNVYEPDDPATHKVVRDMYTEQVGWAAEAGVDFVIAETIDYPGEALLALEAIKAHGLDAVVTLTIHREPIVRGG